MKIRTGFVSNSSSSSFCLYGWSFKDYSEASDVCRLFLEVGKSIIPVNTPGSEVIVGLGNHDEEMDHYDENWQDYECEQPYPEDYDGVNKVCELHPELVEKYGCPQTYSETFFDG